ncbi:ubiquitin-conjugating enzyme E2 Z-like [Haemaphysalis longicornis]
MGINRSVIILPPTLLPTSPLLSSGTKKKKVTRHVFDLRVSPKGNGGMALKKPFGIDTWDPIPIELEVPSPQCLQRTKRDLRDIYEQPPPGVFVAPEEHNITKIDAIVVGPFDTPYEGGFFHFVLKCPTDYPIAPPRVRLMTTDGGRVCFHPHLYANGKICLSILGTWMGPAWSAAQSIATVLMSIQSLMSETPYANRPGYLNQGNSSPSKRYVFVQHETIRVAVCGTVESCLMEACPLPPTLREAVLRLFLDYYDTYENVVRSNLESKGFSMWDFFSGCKFDYDGLLKNLQALKQRVKNRGNLEPGDDQTPTGGAPGFRWI